MGSEKPMGAESSITRSSSTPICHLSLPKNLDKETSCSYLKSWLWGSYSNPTYCSKVAEIDRDRERSLVPVAGHPSYPWDPASHLPRGKTSPLARQPSKVLEGRLAPDLPGETQPCLSKPWPPLGVLWGGVGARVWPRREAAHPHWGPGGMEEPLWNWGGSLWAILGQAHN